MPITHSTSPSELRTELRGAGLRVTESRLAVLAALAERPHSGADTVFRDVRATLPRTSIQAVYGVLGALTDAGLLRRIEPAGSSALYERRVDDNHHHLVCRSCGQVQDVDCTSGVAPCLASSQDHGFAIDQAEVTFWGTCPACREAAAHPTSSPRPTDTIPH